MLIKILSLLNKIIPSVKILSIIDRSLIKIFDSLASIYIKLYQEAS